MQLLHSFRSALWGPDRGEKRNKADIADAPTRNLSEQDGGVPEEPEEADGDGQEEGPDEPQKHSSSVIGAFLTPRERSPSPSPSPSRDGSYQPSDLPLSEYNSLNSQKKSKWNPPTTHKFRLSCTCWLIIFGLAMVFLAVILTTVLVLTHHPHKAAADVDFTVDLGYSKYTGLSAADDEIVKWLGIRYAAPPVGDLRFKAPQPPLVNDQVQQANTVWFISFFYFKCTSLTIPVRKCLPPNSFHWYRFRLLRRLSLPQCLRSPQRLQDASRVRLHSRWRIE